MKRLLALLVLCWWLPAAQAQLIRNNRGRVVENQDFFHAGFISKNNIKAIQGDVSHKKVMQTIQTFGLVKLFEFDRGGKMIHSTSTFRQRGGRIDTTSISYQYDDVHQLIEKNTDQSLGFITYRYAYNDSGQLTEQSYSRGANLTDAQYKLERGREIVINEEKYVHERIGERQWKKTFINTDGKPFKYSILTYDSVDNLTDELQRFVVTNSHIMRSFTYNEMGYLTELKDQSWIAGQSETIYRYKYDAHGNLLEERTVVNGQPTRLREFLYHQDTLLLKAQLVKDEATGDIDIIKYNYTFFD